MPNAHQEAEDLLTSSPGGGREGGGLHPLKHGDGDSGMSGFSAGSQYSCFSFSATSSFEESSDYSTTTSYLLSEDPQQRSVRQTDR